MNGLIFAEPSWLWGGLVLLPLLLLRLASHLRAARQLPGLVSPRLAHRLVNGAGPARRWTVFALQSLAIACLFAALARPQWGYEEIETEFDARNLLLAIDTSRSMMADDLPPNRLSRAKLAAKDIVLSLPDDRIGLVAFAGRPFLQAPLTSDHEAVLEAIDQLDTETIPRGGTNLSAAVALALETVKEAELGPSALVLFSDGEALEGLDEVERTRKRAAEAGLTVLAVGVGTAGGAIIPETDDAGQILPGVFVKDENGQVVRTRLTTEALRALAADGGHYLHLGGASPLTQIVDRIRQRIASSREEGETTRRPIERFLWPLSAAFALLVLSHLVPLLWLKPKPAPVRLGAAKGRQRASPVALSVLLCGIHASLTAADPLAVGQASFAQGDYAEALAAYEGRVEEASSQRARARLHLGIGAAAYRLEDYERAAEAYGAALAEGKGGQRSAAHYNLGNTLFRSGEAALASASSGAGDPDAMRSPASRAETVERAIRDWEGAIEHFESSLAIDPDDSHAAHNLEYVKKRLEELKRQQEQEQQQEQEKDQEQDEEKKEDEEKDKQDQPSDENQKQDGSQDPSDEKSEDPKSEGQDQNPENPSEDQNPGEPDSPEDGKDGEGEQSPPPSPGDAPPQEPEAPRDGELEANPNQSQPQQADPSNAAEAQPHPETGYSPTEARQLLDALADETEVRPILPPAKNEKFKNW